MASAVYFCSVCLCEAHSFCGHSLNGAMSLFELLKPPRANTHQSPSPPSLVCFALISVRMQPAMCVWVSFCLCVLSGPFIVMAPWGQRCFWRKSKHTSLDQYWLFACLSLNLCYYWAQYMKNRCTAWCKKRLTKQNWNSVNSVPEIGPSSHQTSSTICPVKKYCVKHVHIQFSHRSDIHQRAFSLCIFIRFAFSSWGVKT